MARSSIPAVRKRENERAKARKFWNGLSNADRWVLGDQLVLGDFDWSEWMSRQPSAEFLREVDKLRMDWESRLENPEGDTFSGVGEQYEAGLMAYYEDQRLKDLDRGGLKPNPAIGHGRGLTKKDKAVVAAFLAGESAESKKLITDGERLHGQWMGGNDLAYWSEGQVVLPDVGTRSAQTVQRAVVRMGQQMNGYEPNPMGRDARAALGAAVGGTLGAAIGQHYDSRYGAPLGAAVGAGAGSFTAAHFAEIKGTVKGAARGAREARASELAPRKKREAEIARNVAVILIDSDEDIAWLREVHIPSLPSNVKSAMLFGNEDYPEKITTFTEIAPTMASRGTVYRPDVDGVYHRETNPRLLSVNTGRRRRKKRRR